MLGVTHGGWAWPGVQKEELAAKKGVEGKGFGGANSVLRKIRWSNRRRKQSFIATYGGSGCPKAKETGSPWGL